MARWAVVVCVALSGSAPACRDPSTPTELSKRTALTTPADLLPNDLDFVLRIDSRRVQNDSVLAGVGRDLAKGSHASAAFGAVWPLLERSRAIFVGGRWMGDGFYGDGVIAVELGSDDTDLRPLDASFRSLPLRAGRDVVAFERASHARDEPALEVVLAGRGIVLATEGEADSLMRIVQSGPDSDRLDPPARGVASIVGRVRGELGTSGLLAKMTAGLVHYSGSLDGGDRIRVEADFVYASDNAAERAAATLRASAARMVLASEPLRTLGDSIKLAENGRALAVRAEVPFAVIASLH